LGLDGLMHFYKESGSGQEDKLVSDFIKSMSWPDQLAKPYCYKASDWLLGKLPSSIFQGITATASGFYAPQGREIRLKASLENLNEHLAAFRFGALKITNFEMETSALYGLGKLLGHNCLTVCVIIANRIRKEFSSNLNQSEAKLIENCLHQFSQL
jgi:uridine phosphorylase